ncbi:hypothetical protein [Streptomyces acidicola]|uniref:hypothetical protein n=1 Tax=Streptomyces acidicola TaxID=2596892 RepID=UPI00342E09F4
MGVIDSQWWGLWWPWVVVWFLTASLWGSLLAYGLVHLRRRRLRSRRGKGTLRGMCFYLDEPKVKGLVDTGGILHADEEEIEDSTKVTRGIGVGGNVRVGSGQARRDQTSERVTRYLRENTPMKVIGLLMDRMREEDVVVRADLRTGRLVPDGALADRMRESHTGEAALTAVPPEHFVSVTGLFSGSPADGLGIVLRAPYGDGEPAAHVKISCESDWVRREIMVGRYYGKTFQARCLGQVLDWDAGELTLEPIAIFL